MDPWYVLRTWSEQYRQETLREARERDPVERARTSSSPHSGRSRANRIREIHRSLLQWRLRERESGA